MLIASEVCGGGGIKTVSHSHRNSRWPPNLSLGDDQMFVDYTRFSIFSLIVHTKYSFYLTFLSTWYDLITQQQSSENVYFYIHLKLHKAVIHYERKWGFGVTVTTNIIQKRKMIHSLWRPRDFPIQNTRYNITSPRPVPRITFCSIEDGKNEQIACRYLGTTLIKTVCNWK